MDERPGTKTVGRCPICHVARFKERSAKAPRYRCDLGDEFEAADWREVPVTSYTARFGGSLRPIPPIKGAQLTAIQARKGDANAIRRVDPSKLERLADGYGLELIARAQDGSAYASPKLAMEIERAAVDYVAEVLKREVPEAVVFKMRHNNPGYDLELRLGSKVVEYVEVKGTTGPEPVFFMTDYEKRFAARNADRYQLVVVCRANSETERQLHATRGNSTARWTWPRFSGLAGSRTGNEQSTSATAEHG